jgi:hypothetical protein
MAGWLTQHVQGYALNSILEITLPVKSFTARIVAASPPDVRRGSAPPSSSIL